jgi:small conductance mechanosensitive channel
MEIELIDRLMDWIQVRGPRILIVVITLFIFVRLMGIVSRKIVKYTRDDDHSTQSEREKRAETLSHLLETGSRIVAVTIGILMVLREMGINIAPLLAGAGIAGLAISFGAQSIVRDFLSGFFILMENQFQIGDFISTDGHSGNVEKINLRTTILRDIDGVLHIIPNGEIKSVKNLTYNWSRVKLDLGVSYDSDIQKVTEVLNGVAEEIMKDEYFGEMFLETPRVLGIQEFGDSQITIRLLANTRPNKQWELARELRYRIKKAFDENGITIPFPQRDVHIRPGTDNKPEIDKDSSN